VRIPTDEDVFAWVPKGVSQPADASWEGYRKGSH